MISWKVKKLDLYKFAVIICCLCSLGYFRLIPIDLGDYRIGLFSVIIAITTCFGILSSKKSHDFSSMVSFVKRYIPVYLFVIVIAVYNSVHYMQYSGFEIFRELIPLNYVWISFPLIYIFSKDKSLAFLKTITKIVVVILLIKAFSWFMYNYLGIVFFDNLLFQYGGWSRDGFIRIDSGCLFFLAIVVSSNYAFGAKKSKAWLAVVLFLVFYTVFISKWRVILVLQLLTIFTEYYFLQRKLSKRVVIFIISTLILAGCFSFGLFDAYLSSFMSNGTYASSTNNRLLTLWHYLDLLQKEKAWLGLGLLNSSIDSSYEFMYRATYGNYVDYYYIDDIGIIGGFVKFGFLSLLLYIPLFNNSVKCFIGALKHRNYTYSGVVAGMCLYMISSCLVYNIFDTQRLFDLPFYIAIYSFIGKNFDRQY